MCYIFELYEPSLDRTCFSPEIQSRRSGVGVMWRDRDPHGELPTIILKPSFRPHFKLNFKSF